jgi:hypothetical protein
MPVKLNGRAFDRRYNDIERAVAHLHGMLDALARG